MDSDSKAITLLSPDRLHNATETMSKAFHEDPLWQYIFPDEQRRQRVLVHFFKALLTLGISKQQTYGIGTLPAGVATWSIPNQPQSLPSLAAITRFLRLAFSQFAIAAIKVRNVFAQFERMQKVYAPEPHYYLQTIGVRPDFQGQGLASRLIRPFLDEADARGMSSYVETMTPSNAGLYEHFGFRCAELYAVPNTQLKIWALYRAAPK